MLERFVWLDRNIRRWEEEMKDLFLEMEDMPRVTAVDSGFGKIYEFEGEFYTQETLPEDLLRIEVLWAQVAEIKANLRLLRAERDSISRDYVLRLPFRKWSTVEDFWVWNYGFLTGVGIAVERRE